MNLSHESFMQGNEMPDVFINNVFIPSYIYYYITFICTKQS